MNVDTATALREPFPAEMVGKLPRGTCRDCSSAPSKVCSKHEKKRCPHCDNYMTTAHVDLDYVGHAAVRDRLIKVDPNWTWAPMAFTDRGLPLIENGMLWITLTVEDVTRPGVGSADGKNGPDAVKEMIGDALRNAGLSFGIAIDLWSKQDLHARAPEPIASDEVIAGLVARMNALEPNPRKQCKQMFFDAFGAPDQLRDSMAAQAAELVGTFETSASDAPGVADGSDPEPTADPLADDGAGAVAGSPAPESAKPKTSKALTLLQTLCSKDPDLKERDARLSWAAGILGHDVASFSDLKPTEVSKLIRQIEEENVA